MPIISLDILESGEIVCREKDCLYESNCANHESAKNKHLETGFTPEIYLSLYNNRCKTKNRKSVYHNYYEEETISKEEQFPFNYKILWTGRLMLKNSQFTIYVKPE